jgi:peptidoglycan/LPS O-acetylase OafA/YrhL
LTWVGVHSLEVYLVHYLLLTIVRPVELPALSSYQGMLTALVNFAVTVTLSVLVIRVLNHSETLQLVLFGKLPKRERS